MKLVSDRLTDKRYIGKVCDKHPELGGLRLKSGRKCVACHNTTRNRIRTGRAEEYAKRRKDKAEAKAEYDRVRYADKKEQILAKVSEWRINNKEKFSAIMRGHVRNRRLAKIQRVPSWADQNAIAAVYAEAKATGMSVDHIVPLRGKYVSGLHVEYNLQLLPVSENASKCNKFTPFWVRGEWRGIDRDTSSVVHYGCGHGVHA